MSKPLFAAALAALALNAAAQTDALSPLDRFVGDWQGTASGQAGSGMVTRRYERVLGGRFIRETNTSRYPAQAQNPKGEVHEHSGMFSYDKARKTLMLRQFHIEGFVNTYRQASEAGAAVLVFESEGFENFSNRWKARETYEFKDDDAFVETFELAAPEQPFQVYSRTELKRVR
ncbi:MAG TPA: heme-binding beta-barrel domain-containing protein [Roseateles sp.]